MGKGSAPIISLPDTTHFPTTSSTVLIVDDNSLNRYLVAQLIAPMHLQMLNAANGEEALQLIRQEKVDLVLLDLVMPKMNGMQVLQHLRADPQLHLLPVLMISAVDELETIVHCLEMGADDFLPKPFNTVILRARVRGCLERKRLLDKQEFHMREIEREKRRVDELLHIIFPDAVLDELKTTGTVKPRRFPDVAVLFADIVSFTPYCDQCEPEEAVNALQVLIEAWERIALENGVQKIKTIGDAFMASAGLLAKVENPVLNCLRCGAAMLEALHQSELRLNARVGIHVGPVAAGVVGRQKYLFDLWGDTVNTAARMEGLGEPGTITLSTEANQRVQDLCETQCLGSVPVKGKGMLEIFRFVRFRENMLRPGSGFDAAAHI